MSGFIINQGEECIFTADRRIVPQQENVDIMEVESRTVVIRGHIGNITQEKEFGSWLPEDSGGNEPLVP